MTASSSKMPRAIRDRKRLPEREREETPLVVTIAASVLLVGLAAAGVVCVLALAVKFWGWVL